MKALFVCNNGHNRSMTAARVFGTDFQTRAKGLYTEFPVTSQDVQWADLIFVMEQRHKDDLLRKFPEAARKRVFLLNIPDAYTRDQPELTKLLKRKIAELNLK